MSLNLEGELKKIFAADRVSTAPADLKKYAKDWTDYYDIKGAAIVFPMSAEEISSLVVWARKNKISLIPSGGRTGMSGGACALNGEVIVSFEKMNKILEFNEADQTVTVQAGMITESLQEFAKEKSLLYPVDFASRGSSQIGGNIATNAGGIKVVRYGLTRDYVMGTKVVTGTGEILNLNQGLIKNATGYDLRHLFTGSEGTLGFIVEATMKLVSPPSGLKVLFLGLPNLDSIMNVFSEFKRNTKLCAFEMVSDKGLKHVLNSTGLSNPLSSNFPFYAVTEVESTSDQDEENILNVFEKTLEQGFVLDGVISQNETQAKQFWRLREDVSESVSKFHPYKNDISVRISKVPDLIRELDPIFSESYPDWEVIWFGHIGDGNLHINILRPTGLSKEDFVKECRNVDQVLFSAIEKLKGSISAEHGVGLSKKSFLIHTRSAAEISLMKQIKSIFDPDGIINPGKVLEL